MTKRMLMDASHAEETRVVVLDGNRLEDFDVETANKRQLKGNIYLAKVVRVEPSLQAAFVEYGGNRHGFLAFGEIHPDYYQIPVADRQRLLQMQAEEARREQEQEDRDAEALAGEVLNEGEDGQPPESRSSEPLETHHDFRPEIEPSELSEQPVSASAAEYEEHTEAGEVPAQPLAIQYETLSAPEVHESPAEYSIGGDAEAVSETITESNAEYPYKVSEESPTAPEFGDEQKPAEQMEAREQSENGEGYHEGNDELIPESLPPETIGGETDTDDRNDRRVTPRFLRNYKIQEVIHRRQILLVQVVKEERGTKGAALTTYISLAGRYCVLMPNSPRGGGISRKITSPADRRRLKEVMAELDLPDGMGLIVRTAGANRPKPEIKRDCEYLLRLWDDIREHTMRSVAPALIYEEASLIKRAIRDVYSRDIEEIIVDGEDSWKAARDFMRMLMPSHAKKVQLWRDPQGQPLFARYQVDSQLDAMLSPTVQLRSGGYLVINQAEALVAIDVNSGRSTRERGIEETALRTNLEAADEIARQLRLRDLAGLIVIDFIDMESRKHNGMVERRLKEALKNDRARIQLGYISHFGLLEMSRQRLRPSLAETSFILCPHCSGTGHVRSTESAAIHVLRGIEEEGGKHRASEIVVHTVPAIALYIFNHKRERLNEIEMRSGMQVIFAPEEGMTSLDYRIERIRARVAEAPAAIRPDAALPAPAPSPVSEDVEEDETAIDPASAEDGDDAVEVEGAANGDDSEQRRRRRRRRRRGGRREDSVEGELASAEPSPEPSFETGTEALAAPVPEAAPEPASTPVPGNAPSEQEIEPVEGVPELAETVQDDPGGRRRGRRGGRRRRRDDELPQVAFPGADQPDFPPFYAGPTPANPFGGQVFDIFDVMEQAERVSEMNPSPAQAASGPMFSMPQRLSDPSLEIPEPPETMTYSGDLEERTEEPPAPANDPEPAVRPIVIGAEETPPSEKKRGWWRR